MEMTFFESDKTVYLQRIFNHCIKLHLNLWSREITQHLGENHFIFILNGSTNMVHAVLKNLQFLGLPCNVHE